jgi:murein DD-endopeptidase MepM/ murein hydrolase activator NlpD
VVFSGFVAGYGNLVEVDHGGGWATRYGHNSANLVAVGDKIAGGQPIALVGQTGRATGDHLHFEVRRDGKAVSPELFLGAEMKGTRLRSRA